MAAPVRDSSSGGNQPTTANFEYDDNEWDIGIGDLIIDLDADIEKTGVGEGMAAPKPGKMHSPVEHQATVDKGLKMKIKRTKPGTKHEIVKSGENGEKHTNSTKRGSSSHRRDKKHGEKVIQKDVNGLARCLEKIDKNVTDKLPYPVTSTAIKDKETPCSGMKKVKNNLSSSSVGNQSALSASGGSGNSSNLNSVSSNSVSALNSNSNNISSGSGSSSGSYSGSGSNSSTSSGSGSSSGGGNANSGSSNNAINCNSNSSNGPNNENGSDSSGASSSTNHQHSSQHTPPPQLTQSQPLPSQSQQSLPMLPQTAQQLPSSSNPSGQLQNHQQLQVPLQQANLPTGSSPPPPSSHQQPPSSQLSQLHQLPTHQSSQSPRQVPSSPLATQQLQSNQSHSTPPTLMPPLLMKSQPPSLMPPLLPPIMDLHSHCLPSPPTLQAQVNSQPPTISPTNTPPPIHKDLVDVCVGTSVGTITEPDCLGPCEPGTSVTLEGIVWHETEGVLVVNVTWRGKTYVGTLLDCTRHDWAPPRFCDSPTSDLDLRTPKGRGKRGRNTAQSNISDLSNFTETRSSVHSKLRSNNAAGPKGRRGPGAASPTPFATPKSETTPGKRKTKTHEEEPPIKKKLPLTQQPSSPLPPPALLECPEPNCSKKYKHINGLKYHQSHAHGSPDDDEAKESGTSEEEVQSPMPDIKKDESADNQPPNLCDETAMDQDEKAVFGYGEDSNVKVNTGVNCRRPTSRTSTPSPLAGLALKDDFDIDNALLPPILTKVQQFKSNAASVACVEDVKPALSPPCPNKQQLLQQPQQEPQQQPQQQSQPPQPPPPPPPPPPPAAQQQPPTPSAQQQQAPQQHLAVSTSPQPTLQQSPQLPQQAQQEQHQVHKKKMRKSPAGSPHSIPIEPPSLGIETGREEVQSPAYSDISDDAAPLLEAEVEGKSKSQGDKKESGHSPLQHYNMFPYYAQPPYLVPSVESKPKDGAPEKIEGKNLEKEKKEAENSDFPFIYSQTWRFDPYSMAFEDKKEDKSIQPCNNKSGIPNSTLHIPNPNKSKADLNLSKDKHQNDNHQILKESIELKSQVNQGMLCQRQGQDVGRYYLYPDRKESGSTKATPPPPKALSSPGPKHKDKTEEKKERRDEEKKQEGVKPTMETQGPPPPPTSQYAYIHPGYMQSPHYGTLPFDPNHPMYRGMNPMLVSGYPNSPYLHPQLHAVPRYAPEDLSRSQGGKALDLLQHHASQYYSHPSHKIHELQERALKSPTPKVSTTTSSPSSAPNGSTPVPVTTSPSVHAQTKSSGSDSKDSRSPPPQRHVHTHHHTHVGLGYPILAGQYPAPYGAAVLATEHAAAVSSVPYQAK